MEEERESMITSFEITSRVMLERLKDLETQSFGQRPNTA